MDFDPTPMEVYPLATGRACAVAADIPMRGHAVRGRVGGRPATASHRSR